MFRGQTWSTEEVQTLVDIWSDETMAKLLASTHKNREVFKLFSEKMAVLGLQRSVDQCRIKVKKLRLQYFRIRDAVGKSGSSAEEKERFVWYDALDSILGSSPTYRPEHVDESFKEEAVWTQTPAEPAGLVDFPGGPESITTGTSLHSSLCLHANLLRVGWNQLLLRCPPNTLSLSLSFAFEC